mgnify:CR=1 FL=1
MIKILLVEDNPLNQDMLSRRLLRQGYEVVVATDGAAGITKAKAENPSLILMDMSIPVLDGWETTRRLKADEQTQSIPIIALTAHAMVGDRDKALAAGCDDYATKPVEFKQLLKTIRSFTADIATDVSAAGSAQSKAQSSNGAAPSVSVARAANFSPLQDNLSSNGVSSNDLSSNGQSPTLAAPEPIQPSSPFTLLVVNDNEINRQILSAHLQRKGYSVIEASDTPTAIAVLRDFSVDLVLLDIVVPATGNLETLRQLRSTYAKTALPAIIMTANDSDDQIVQAFDIGANDYVTKPINLAIVMARIRSQLETLQATRQQISSAQPDDATEVDSAPPASSQPPVSSQVVSAQSVPAQSVPARTFPSQFAASSQSAFSSPVSSPPVSSPPASSPPASFQQVPDLSAPAQTAQSARRTSANFSFPAKSYPLHHTFARSPLSHVELVKHPDVSTADLCLVEVFSPGIEDDSVLEDFRAELAVERSRLKAISRHDHIAEVLSFFKQEGTFGWFQAYTEGQLLLDSLSEGQQAEPKMVLQSIRDMLEALVPFHAQQIVHSSLQPGHLWRCSSDGRLQLLNLGLSQRLSVYLSGRSPEKYKPFDYEHVYMPIEQRIGEAVLSSDIYAVGMIALQMLTGKTPEVLTNILLSSASPLQLLPSMTPDMADILSKMLSQDHRERYLSAERALKDMNA